VRIESVLKKRIVTKCTNAGQAREGDAQTMVKYKYAKYKINHPMPHTKCKPIPIPFL